MEIAPDTDENLIILCSANLQEMVSSEKCLVPMVMQSDESNKPASTKAFVVCKGILFHVYELRHPIPCILSIDCMTENGWMTDSREIIY